MKQNDLTKQLETFCDIIFHILEVKTPHTMEHIKRVPILADMIAKEVSKTIKKPFSKDDLYKINLAAKLHDCGKTTTNDYLLEKSTKIEFLRNRIHEIRDRFEILRRDAEIKYLKQCLAHPENKKEYLKTFRKTEDKLEKDFKFVADCNTGDMAVTEKEIKKLSQIGSKKFKRTFNRLLGLSWYEKNLLTEDQRHIYQKPSMENILQDNPEDTYKDIPTGELYNLSIFKGTINKEERKRIERHASETAIILDMLKLPKEYKDMTKYAAEHHEQPSGKGYPLGLKEKDLSIPSRIMTVADIFEALTSSGRPYKTPKKLSEALRIMQIMKKNQQIDADIYQLCIKNKIFMKYAHKYLSPSQIDVEDLEVYL